jgi:hypothetical protein
MRREKLRAGHGSRIWILVSVLLLTGSLTLPARAADALYDALLKNQPRHLPAGFEVAQISSGPIDQEDRNAGMTGNAQITLRGADPKAKINYLLFPDERAANAYLIEFDSALRTHQASRVSVPALPTADCGETPGNAGCAIGAGRIAVFSLGTKVDGSVGPLLKAALDHLNAVKKATGLE